MDYKESLRLQDVQHAVEVERQNARALVWDRRFLEVAKLISTWSKDPSTQVGCVVVGPHREIRSTGFNGLPRGVQDTPERLNNREVKYPLIVHAEENVVAHAARIGQSLVGCTAYVTFPPCARCARLLIQAGVIRVVCPEAAEVPERWADEIRIARDMLVEADVALSAV